MKKYILILIVLFTVSFIQAQTIHIKWGQKLDEKELNNFIFLKKDSLTNNTYWLSEKDKKYVIYTFDESNIQAHAEAIIFPYNILKQDSASFTIKEILPVEDKILFLITSSHVRKNLQRQYIWAVAIEGGERQPMVQVSEEQISYSRYPAHYHLLNSPDKKTILINEIKGDEYAFMLLDKDLQLVASKTYTIPNSAYTYDYIATMQIDNNSTIYFSRLADSTATINKRKVYLSNYIVDVFNPTTGFYKKLSISEGWTDNTLTLQLNKNGALLLTGFYSTSNNRIYEGVFYGTLDEHFNLHIKTNLFSKDIDVLDLENAERITNSCIPKGDGGAFFISETSTERNSGNILIADINTLGTINRYYTIKKKQVISYRQIESFYACYDEKEKVLSIFYNDHIKNNTDALHKLHVIHARHIVPVVARIDSSGNLSKTSISDESPTVIPCPSLFQKISDNEVMIFGRQEYDTGIGSMQFSASSDNVQIQPGHLHIIDSASIAGICLALKNKGNRYGIKLSLLDRNVKSLSGINLGILTSRLEQSNGLSLGLFLNEDKKQNGISFGTLTNTGNERNGLVIAGIFTNVVKTNGVMISGLVAGGKEINGALLAFGTVSQDVNGLAVSFIKNYSIHMNGVSASIINLTDELNGLAIGGLNVSSDLHGAQFAYINVSEKIHGFQFGLIGNAAWKGRGVQIGFINYMGNNPKWLKWLPLINMHLGKTD